MNRLSDFGRRLALRIRSLFGRSWLASGVRSTLALDDLLAGVTEENLHQEFDTGPAVGNEFWG